MLKPCCYPDILARADGAQAATAAEWLASCRPRLESTVLHEEYGVLPPFPRSMQFHGTRVDRAALGGLATLREIDVVMEFPDAVLRLLLVTPNGLDSPAPCFLGLNFGGNHRVVDDPLIRAPEGRRGEDVQDERGLDGAAWPVETIIKSGYALATLFNGDAVPDDAERAGSRLRDFAPAVQAADGGDAPGALACWAWCLSRAMDALEREDSVDSRRVAFMGHSRNGKAALLATAMDPRPAAAIICQSGCGGIGPSRDIGEEWSARETVAQITEGFPHWFCRNFSKYRENVDLLPFDQHALVALCAPRPVLISSAADDRWANPIGSFEMLVAAGPVYRLFGAGGIDPQPMPPPGTLLPSRLGHFLRTGGHQVTAEDWDAWLAYMDRWLAS